MQFYVHILANVRSKNVTGTARLRLQDMTLHAEYGRSGLGRFI